MRYVVHIFQSRRESVRGPYDDRESAQAIFTEEVARIHAVREPCGVAIGRWRADRGREARSRVMQRAA